MKRLLLLAAALITAAAITIPAQARAAIGAVTTVCGTQTMQVHVPKLTYFTVFNAPPAQNTTCVKATPGHASFTVLSTDEHGDWGYPNISSGWEAGEYSCLDASGACYSYPVEEQHDGMPVTSLGVNMHGDGNASYDIWFNKTDAHPVQDNGTEIMIWLKHPGVNEYGSIPVTIEGIRFRIMHWTSEHSGVTWHYAAYIMVTQRSSVNQLWLNPFFRDAISRHYLSPDWWLTGIDAGFELTAGGAGSVATLQLHGVK